MDEAERESWRARKREEVLERTIHQFKHNLAAGVGDGVLCDPIKFYSSSQSANLTDGFS